MVLVHYKKTEHNQFIVEVPGSIMIEELIPLLVQMNNIRIKIDLFACALEDLATHGPLRPEEIRGLSSQDLIDNALVLASEDKKKWAHKPQPKEGQRFNEDKTHYRTGIILSEHVTQMLIDTSVKAKKLISYTNADQRVVTSLKGTPIVIADLKEAVEQMKAALIIAYPGYNGLGEWQTAIQLAEDKYDLEQRNTNTIDYLDPKESTLWAVGKQYHKGKPLNHYIGKNQKTKIIVKLTKEGSGAPMRQPAIDKATQTEMMARWHKKQEEMKKLETNNEDDYLNSAWANPNSLKNYLVTGGRQIQWKGGKKL